MFLTILNTEEIRVNSEYCLSVRIGLYYNSWLKHEFFTTFRLSIFFIIVIFFFNSDYPSSVLCPIHQPRIFSSPWAESSSEFFWSLVVRCLSVCPSDCLSVNLSYFQLLKNHWANFNQTWHKVSLSEGDSSLSNEGPCPFPRGGNYKIVKIHWRNSNSNEVPHLFSRRDNYEIANLKYIDKI